MSSIQQVTKTSLEKLPPFDLDAEKAILGACLLDDQAIFKALSVFSPSDFYRPSHRTIFQAMYDLTEQGGVVDLLTLRDILVTRGEFDKVGGGAFLVTLADVVPTASNIEFHAQIVHERAIKRNLLNASLEIATRCYDDKTEAEDVLELAEQKVFEISENRVKRPFVSIVDAIPDSFATLEKMAIQTDPITGLPTGFVDLDRMLSGLQPSDLILLAARPAMGKTALALNIADHTTLKHKTTVAMFSLEMSIRQLTNRLLLSKAKVTADELRHNTVDDQGWSRLTSASDVLSTGSLYIDDTAGQTMTEIRSKVKRLKMEHGLGFVIVDYLQLMESRGRRENRQQEITEISRGLKKLAKELDVPVLALSQLSRAVEQRTDKRPQLSDLRESGALEQDADIVMFIYRPEVYDAGKQPGLAEILISKHRNGPTGSVWLQFEKAYTRFNNLDDTYDFAGRATGGIF